MTVIKILVIAGALFFGMFAFSHPSVIDSAIIPCESSLLAYCWTADTLGTGLAWIMWHGAVSLLVAWAIVALSSARELVR